MYFFCHFCLCSTCPVFSVFLFLFTPWIKCCCCFLAQSDQSPRVLFYSRWSGKKHGNFHSSRERGTPEFCSDSRSIYRLSPWVLKHSCFPIISQFCHHPQEGIRISGWTFNKKSRFPVDSQMQMYLHRLHGCVVTCSVLVAVYLAVPRTDSIFFSGSNFQTVCTQSSEGKQLFFSKAAGKIPSVLTLDE